MAGVVDTRMLAEHFRLSCCFHGILETRLRALQMRASLESLGEGRHPLESSGAMSFDPVKLGRLGWVTSSNRNFAIRSSSRSRPCVPLVLRALPRHRCGGWCSFPGDRSRLMLYQDRFNEKLARRKVFARSCLVSSCSPRHLGLHTASGEFGRAARPCCHSSIGAEQQWAESRGYVRLR